IEVRPATVFEDVATMLGPKRPDANVCWCLSYRIPSRENLALRGPARAKKVAELMAHGPIGVLAYDGDEVVGWAAVAPRAETSFARNRKIPRIDDLDVWSVWCFRVRPGYRRRGISHALLAGAVEFARARRAGDRGLSGRQPRRAGRSHDGVCRHARVVREGRVPQGRRHDVGRGRFSARADAARVALGAASIYREEASGRPILDRRAVGVRAPRRVADPVR